MGKSTFPIPALALERIRVAKAAADLAQNRYQELAVMALLGMGLDPARAHVRMDVDGGAVTVDDDEHEHVDPEIETT